MFNKKLLERIKSLESLLGVRYSDNGRYEGYSDVEHIISDYGILRRINELLKKNKKE